MRIPATTSAAVAIADLNAIAGNVTCAVRVEVPLNVHRVTELGDGIVLEFEPFGGCSAAAADEQRVLGFGAHPVTDEAGGAGEHERLPFLGELGNVDCSVGGLLGRACWFLSLVGSSLPV